MTLDSDIRSLGGTYGCLAIGERKRKGNSLPMFVSHSFDTKRDSSNRRKKTVLLIMWLEFFLGRKPKLQLEQKGNRWTWIRKSIEVQTEKS